MTLTETILAQMPGDPLQGLHQADQVWRSLRDGTLPLPSVIHQAQDPLGEADWDVVICGGTLGIFLGAVLAQRGWRTALLERGVLRGREQEWNISRHELQVFVDLGLLSVAELEQAIVTEYNPARIAFKGGPEFWVRDVLNVGVDPLFLLDCLKSRFLAWGGTLLEHTAFAGAIVHPDGVRIVGAAGLKTRLLIDAMGHFSPIARQARQGERPDGVCLVVGSCAQGYPVNQSGDLMVSFTSIQQQYQYFWEAFPARDGRTTYLFTYGDAHPDRPDLAALYEDYLQLLPEYQGVALDQLQFRRALFGCFPCYRQSPLRSAWNRILHVGDSSGNQSPLSFGGFGAMVRHLQRLTEGVDDALKQDLLDRAALSCLQPYQPNLTVTWLFQRAMRVELTQSLPPDQINQLLSGVFQVMSRLGDRTLKPFLQDVVQFPALSLTLLQVSLRYPGLVLQIIPHVSLRILLDWMGHYLALGAYTAVYPLSLFFEPKLKALSPTQQYFWRARIQALRYGSGNDYRGSSSRIQD
ncbi:FAD-dependent oxidoreductase [Leptolyngbya sp. 'hensonii']|uniref:NAD(P)/FAD-dependent oxidoreductase n=1 Tax=Leptolyngbya sp. 'hensonii' TaxID=1922337 RepID=UPI00094F7A6B|nr:FAD-dependent oxidoreductase [Leptolyngbya sp. 'hensonii']OLP20186.1 FAD-dependent oxidoreductase [Leptolyngbya sp. 'hensonii']